MEQAICGKKGSSIRRIPLADMDKSIIIQPDEWEDIQTYMDIMAEEYKIDCK